MPGDGDAGVPPRARHRLLRTRRRRWTRRRRQSTRSARRRRTGRPRAWRPSSASTTGTCCNCSPSTRPTPGHYVQHEYSNRNPSLIRTHALAPGTFVEGWAVYMEQTMLDQGYGRDDLAAAAQPTEILSPHCDQRHPRPQNALHGHDRRRGIGRCSSAGPSRSDGEARLKIVRAKQSSVPTFDLLRRPFGLAPPAAATATRVGRPLRAGPLPRGRAGRGHRAGQVPAGTGPPTAAWAGRGQAHFSAGDGPKNEPVPRYSRKSACKRGYLGLIILVHRNQQ